MLNPLEQFQIKKIIPISIMNIDISFTNSSLMMAFVLFITLVLYFTLLKKNAYRTINKKILNNSHSLSVLHDVKHRVIPGYMAVFCEMLYKMVEDMTHGTAGEKSKKFIPFIFTLYMFILLCNLIGMIPASYTATSQIIVTFSIAIFIFIGITLIGFVKHGFGYLSLLLPQGTPTFLMPLMFVIELFAYLARPISLSLRLAANMTAGHIVLKVIASFVIMAGVFGVIPFVFLVIITGFEIFIAILQAYIFAILTCVYLNDALNLH